MGKLLLISCRFGSGNPCSSFWHVLGNGPISGFLCFLGMICTSARMQSVYCPHMKYQNCAHSYSSISLVHLGSHGLLMTFSDSHLLLFHCFSIVNQSPLHCRMCCPRGSTTIQAAPLLVYYRARNWCCPFLLHCTAYLCVALSTTLLIVCFDVVFIALSFVTSLIVWFRW